MYWLKKEDMPLILFDIEKGSYGDQSIHIRWMSEKTEDLPEMISDESSLEAWIQHRMIPRNRAFVEEILASQGLKYKDMEGLITICKGLSVNDVYWIVPEDFQGRFDDYNLYDNSFSEALSLVAFTGYSTTLKELSPSPEMTTNGMLPKAWRRLNDKLYLYKGGTNAELFSNAGLEPYSEFYAAQIAAELEISHVSYDLQKWKGILASVCENFTNKERSYVPVGTVLKKRSIKELVEKMKEIGCFSDFKNMILLDALINNEDRHYGNFGFLKDNSTNQYLSLAPLFDHGISLFSTMPERYIANWQWKTYQYEHRYSALGATHDELVSWFCDQTDARKLSRLSHFEFKKHERYNVSEERLKFLNTFIRNRALELIEVIQKGIKPKKENVERIEVNQEFLGFRYQFTGDRMQGGHCVILDQNNNRIKILNLTSSDLEKMDAVTFIEDYIENTLYPMQKTNGSKERTTSDPRQN